MDDTKCIKQDIQKLINSEDFLKLEYFLNQFNVFKALNLKTKENQHSDFLAFLFNPKESHGLRDFFLKEFLKETFPERSIEIDAKNFSNILIKREWSSNKNRLDLLLLDSQAKEIYAIEHKIQSKQGKDQLKRYSKDLDKKFKEYKKYLIFLTKSGEQAQIDTWKSVDYDIILNCVNKTLNCYKYPLSHSIKELLHQYKTTIERYILMSDETLNTLCKSLYQNHREALEYIMHNADSEDSVSDAMKMIGKALENYKNLFDIYKTKGEKKILLSLKEFGRYKQLQAPDEKDSLFKKSGSYIGILFEPRYNEIRCLLLISSTQTNEDTRSLLVDYFRNNLDTSRKVRNTERYTTIASFPHFISEFDLENIKSGTWNQGDIDKKIKKVINQYEEHWKPNIQIALKYVKNNLKQ